MTSWNAIDWKMTTRVLEMVQAVFCSCNLSSKTDLSEVFEPDVVFIDEAAQGIEPDVMIPLAANPTARTIIISGDHKQLQPVLLSSGGNECSKQLIMSPFERWHAGGYNSFSLLAKGYRFDKANTEFVSRTFCDNKFVSGLGSAQQNMLVNRWANPFNDWFESVNGARSAWPCLIVNTTEPSMQYRDGTSLYNPEEAKLVVSMVKPLVQRSYGQIHEQDICIIAPYSGQRQYISKLMVGTKVRVASITQIQGAESKIVFISWCKYNPLQPADITFIAEPSRLNVAISRHVAICVNVVVFEKLRIMPLKRPGIADFLKFVQFIDTKRAIYNSRRIQEGLAELATASDEATQQLHELSFHGLHAAETQREPEVRPEIHPVGSFPFHQSTLSVETQGPVDIADEETADMDATPLPLSQAAPNMEGESGAFVLDAAYVRQLEDALVDTQRVLADAEARKLLLMRQIGRARVVCGECDGDGVVPEGVCPECGGRGWVRMNPE